MSPDVYYNENDDGAADWLEWLIAERLIPPGWVDRRSIADVRPGDLAGFDVCHFFAGIGGWALAIQLAGAPSDWPIWTASCPCQPFSSAGRRLGSNDPRHLWPHVLRLADACGPPRIVGEQVAGKAGYDWWDGVSADLAGIHYASRAVDIPAAAVDAPQIRQRLYWVAVAGADGGRCEDARHARTGQPAVDGIHAPDALAGRGGAGGRLIQQERGPEGRTAAAGDDARELAEGVAQGDPSFIGRGEGLNESALHGRRRAPSSADGAVGHEGAAQGRASGRRLALRELPGWSDRLEAGWGHAPGTDDGGVAQGDAYNRWGEEQDETLCARWRPTRLSDGRNGSWWAGADWIICHDGKARRVADAIAPLLVARFPGRVGAWRGIGNAIVPPLACEVISALAETEGEHHED